MFSGGTDVEHWLKMFNEKFFEKGLIGVFRTLSNIKDGAFETTEENRYYHFLGENLITMLLSRHSFSWCRLVFSRFFDIYGNLGNAYSWY